MSKSANAIRFDGVRYLECMNCGDMSDPCDRYQLQVDRILAVNHASHRVTFEICAACYRDLFPWRLDWIDNV